MSRNYISIIYIFVLTSLAMFAGCKKDEGEGGTSTINGKLILHDYDASYQILDPTAIKPVADKSVYIIYGKDRTIYDDDFHTSYDGSYEFKNLQKGTYKLYAYSKDSTGAFNGTINPDADDIPSFVQVEITENGSTVTAPDIIVINNNH